MIGGKRGIRRHHRERVKAKRQRQFGDWWPDGDIHPSLIDTPHPCSCIGCGNQRRYEGPTLQERRSSGSIHPRIFDSTATLQFEFNRWEEASELDAEREFDWVRSRDDDCYEYNGEGVA
jgi:hypothetical protein